MKNYIQQYLERAKQTLGISYKHLLQLLAQANIYQIQQ